MTDAADRPTVVAVHGNGGGAFRFARVEPYLAGRVRWHAVTLPGFAAVPADPSLRTMRDYGDALGRLVDAARPPGGPPPIVVGHGIGGSIALDLAVRAPERLGGLVLHAPVGARLDTRLFPRLMRLPGARSLTQRLIASPIVRPVWRRAFFDTPVPKAYLDQFFTEYRHCSVFGQMFDLITVEWFDALTPVSLPSVLLWGDGDRVLGPDQLAAFRRVLPDAEVRTVAGWDHFPMIEQPQEYADAIVELATTLGAR